MPDPTLEYWADRYIEFGLSASISFQRFLHLPLADREQRIKRAELRSSVPSHIEQAEASTPMHGDRLISPIQHVSKEHRRPWFYRRWRGRRDK